MIPHQRRSRAAATSKMERFVIIVNGSQSDPSLLLQQPQIRFCTLLFLFEDIFQNIFFEGFIKNILRFSCCYLQACLEKLLIYDTLFILPQYFRRHYSPPLVVYSLKYYSYFDLSLPLPNPKHHLKRSQNFFFIGHHFFLHWSLLVACCFLLIACYFVFVARYSLLCCSLFSACCLLLSTRCSVFSTRCSLLSVFCSLRFAWDLLLCARYSLLFACCSLLCACQALLSACHSLISALCSLPYDIMISQ